MIDIKDIGDCSSDQIKYIKDLKDLAEQLLAIHHKNQLVSPEIDSLVAVFAGTDKFDTRPAFAIHLFFMRKKDEKATLNEGKTIGIPEINLSKVN